MMKKFLIIFVLVFTVNSFATDPPATRAQGVFLAFGVGPRLPLGDFSTSTDIGYGFNIELSYTDNETDIGFNSEYNALHIFWVDKAWADKKSESQNQNNSDQKYGEQYFDVARKSQLSTKLISLIAEQYKKSKSQKVALNAKNTA